jgi:hypothetical protein
VVGRTFGHPARFAITLKDFWGEGDAFRVVDVYAADRWLTCDDNHAYVPHFVGMLARTVRRLIDEPGYRDAGRPFRDLTPADNHHQLCTEASEDNSRYLDYRFMDWGPTADNVRMHYFREGDTAFLPFSFWRADHHDRAELGQVFVAELPWRELASVLHDAAWSLMWVWADRSHWPRQAEPGDSTDPAGI